MAVITSKCRHPILNNCAGMVACTTELAGAATYTGLADAAQGSSCELIGAATIVSATLSYRSCA